MSFILNMGARALKRANTPPNQATGAIAAMTAFYVKGKVLQQGPELANRVSIAATQHFFRNSLPKTFAETIGRNVVAPLVMPSFFSHVLPKLAWGASLATYGAINLSFNLAAYALHKYSNYQYQNEVEAAGMKGTPMMGIADDSNWIEVG